MGAGPTEEMSLKLDGEHMFSLVRREGKEKDSETYYFKAPMLLRQHENQHLTVIVKNSEIVFLLVDEMKPIGSPERHQFRLALNGMMVKEVLEKHLAGNGIEGTLATLVRKYFTRPPKEFLEQNEFVLNLPICESIMNRVAVKKHGGRKTQIDEMLALKEVYVRKGKDIVYEDLPAALLSKSLEGYEMTVTRHLLVKWGPENILLLVNTLFYMEIIKWLKRLVCRIPGVEEVLDKAVGVLELDDYTKDFLAGKPFVWDEQLLEYLRE